MVLQNLIYPKPGICTEEALYFRRFGDVRYTWTKDCIFADQGGIIEFDTYFNSFSAGKWFKYTNVDNVSVQLIQVESGAVWNGGNLYSLKGNLNLNDLDACLFNEFEEYTQYNAWWYCVIPVGVIRDDNLPLPLFIRGDDVEYG